MSVFSNFSQLLRGDSHPNPEQLLASASTKSAFTQLAILSRILWGALISGEPPSNGYSLHLHSIMGDQMINQDLCLVAQLPLHFLFTSKAQYSTQLSPSHYPFLLSFPLRPSILRNVWYFMLYDSPLLERRVLSFGRAEQWLSNLDVLHSAENHSNQHWRSSWKRQRRTLESGSAGFSQAMSWNHV